MKKISIGIDTSCYTTSILAFSDKIIFEKRIILKVKEGSVGLRQSEAFFQHVQNLSEIYHELSENVDLNSIKNIVVSNAPRPIEDSYMPVFTAGISFGRVISDTLKIPLFFLSHQENHLYASIYEKNNKLDKFIGVHISGGTNEILLVDKKEKLNIEIVAGTLDISFGKLIDRIGVYMDIKFPCGKELDKLAKFSDKKLKMNISIKDGNINISGIENKLKTYYDKNKNVEDVARILFEYISSVLIKQLDFIKDKYEIENIVFSGGVSANSMIRENLKKYYGNKIFFSSIKYATDHSLGNGYYGSLVMDY